MKHCKNIFILGVLCEWEHINTVSFFSNLTANMVEIHFQIQIADFSILHERYSFFDNYNDMFKL